MSTYSKLLGKKVYIELKKGTHPYSGKVLEVDEAHAPYAIYITIIDKFEKRVIFHHAEISMIKEEGEI